MSKKTNKSLAEELRSSALIWVGRTDKDLKVLIQQFNSHYHVILVEETDENVILKADKDALLLKSEICKALYEVFPYLKKKEVGTIPTTSFAKVKVVEDYNEICFNESIKVLPEKLVLDTLTSAGFDTTKYTYFKIKVDNSHSLVKATVATGYDKYPAEAQKYFKDVSKYKAYEVDKKDEFTMLDLGCYLGIIAAGPAGVGKTTDFFADSAQKVIPVIDFQCLHNTEAEDLFGRWQPKESGGYEFVYGPLALAGKYDTRLSIQEFNYAPTAVQSALNSFMDDNGTMTLPNGEVIHRGPNFRLFLTVNPGYRGTNAFNPATLNRFATVYYAPITKEVLIARLQFETGYKNTKVLETIADKFDKLRDIFESKNMEVEITYRNALRFVKMILLAPEVSVEKQFDMAFVNNAIYEMNDIPTELSDLKEISREYITEIKEALVDGIEDVKLGSWSCDPGVDLDDLTSQIGDDGSFLDLEEGDDN